MTETTWKPSPITCGGCAAKWTAHSWAHCGACHRTFSGVSLFDLHRSADGDHGTCLDPATIRDKTGQPRLVYRDGAWRHPEMSPGARAKLRGGR